MGASALLAASFAPNVWTTAIACFIVGLGLGLVASPTLIAAQSSVPWAERGVVTGANMFLRSLGSAVGVAIFGAVANGVIARSGLGEHSPVAIHWASTAVFIAVLVTATVTIVAAVAMPAAHVDDIEHREVEQPATVEEPHGAAAPDQRAMRPVAAPTASATAMPRLPTAELDDGRGASW